MIISNLTEKDKKELASMLYHNRLIALIILFASPIISINVVCYYLFNIFHALTYTYDFTFIYIMLGLDLYTIALLILSFFLLKYSIKKNLPEKSIIYLIEKNNTTSFVLSPKEEKLDTSILENLMFKNRYHVHKVMQYTYLTQFKYGIENEKFYYLFTPYTGWFTRIFKKKPLVSIAIKKENLTIQQKEIIKLHTDNWIYRKH